MIFNLLQIFLVLIIFFSIKLSTWKLTEEIGLPQFLRYEPYVCNRCLTFWTLIGIFLVCGIICHLWITMSVGLALTILDTIAKTIDQRKNTISIEEIDENNILVKTSEK